MRTQNDQLFSLTILVNGFKNLILLRLLNAHCF